MSSLALRTAAPTPVTPPSLHSTIYLVLDVHKNSITNAVLPKRAKEPTRLERPPNSLPKPKEWTDCFAGNGEAQACYEASSADTCSSARYATGDMRAR